MGLWKDKMDYIIVARTQKNFKTRASQNVNADTCKRCKRRGRIHVWKELSSRIQWY